MSNLLVEPDDGARGRVNREGTTRPGRRKPTRPENLTQKPTWPIERDSSSQSDAVGRTRLQTFDSDDADSFGLSSAIGWEWHFGWRCFGLMDRAAYYRDRAEHIRRLADAAWQPELKEALRRLANDHDEVAEDIETGAPTIRHSELLYR